LRPASAPDTLFDAGSSIGAELLPVTARAVGSEGSEKKMRGGELSISGTIDAVVDSPVSVSAATDAVGAKTRSAASAAIRSAGARRRVLRLHVFAPGVVVEPSGKLLLAAGGSVFHGGEKVVAVRMLPDGRLDSSRRGSHDRHDLRPTGYGTH
jgi:hypothetical protein